MKDWLSGAEKLGAAIGIVTTLLLVLGYLNLSTYVKALGFEGILLGHGAKQYAQYFAYGFGVLYQIALSTGAALAIVLSAGWAVHRPLRRVLRCRFGRCHAPFWLDAVLTAVALAALVVILPLAAGAVPLSSPLSPEADPLRCVVIGSYLRRGFLFGLACLTVLLLGLIMRWWWQRLGSRRRSPAAMAGLLTCAMALTISLPSLPAINGKLFLPVDVAWVELLTKTQASGGLSPAVDGWLLVVMPEAYGLWRKPTESRGQPRPVILSRSAVITMAIDPARRRPLAELLAPELRTVCDRKETTTMLSKRIGLAFALLVVAAGLVLARVDMATAADAGAADGAVRIAFDRWQGFFSVAKNGLVDFMRVVETLPHSFRGDDGELKNGVTDKGAGDIWVHDLTTQQSRRLTSDGGYRSPHGSPDGNWVCFLRGGHPGIMRRDGSARRIIDDGGAYRQLLGCDMDTGEVLLGDADGRVLLLSLQDGKARPVMPELDGEPIPVDRLLAFSRLAPDGRRVYVRAEEGVWRLLVTRRDYLEPRVLLTQDRPIADPTWTGSGAEVLWVAEAR